MKISNLKKEGEYRKMQLYINCVSADKILQCKKDNEEVVKRLKLINPQYAEGEVFFDVAVNLPDNFTITNKHEGVDNFIIIYLSNLGKIELNVKDFRDILLY